MSIETKSSKAFQSHPGDSSTDPNFEALQPKYGGPKYAPAVDRRATATAYSEEELMSTPYRHGQTNRNPRGAQTFSPGPAFPALGQEPGLRYNSPSHLPQATNANIRATGPYAADHTQQHRFNGPPVVGAESPHPPWQRRFGAEQPHHTSNYSSNSLENYVNVRPARRTHRTGPRHRKNKTPRPKRIDQGPEPSNADIYPDDDAFVAVQEENGRRYDLDATMHAGMYNMTLGDFNEEPTEMWSSPPHPSSSPHNIQDVQAQMANPVCAINPAYLPVWPSEQDVEDIPDGVSDLGHLSPLSTDSYPDMEGSSAYTATPAGASRRPKLTLPPAEQLRPMEPDQIDGSRYGLKNGGLGLHSVGDVWMPPKPKPGTQFADMGYLWDSAEPSARAR
jgi:hypothetical protein